MNLLTGQHWDPAGGEFPESTCAAGRLVLGHPWACCILDKHSAQEHHHSRWHATTSQPSEHSSWGWHTHSLLLYTFCTKEQQQGCGCVVYGTLMLCLLGTARMMLMLLLNHMQVHTMLQHVAGLHRAHVDEV